MADSTLFQILLAVIGVLATVGGWWCKRVFEKIDKIIERFDAIGEQLQNLYKDFSKGDSALWQYCHELETKIARIEATCENRVCKGD